MQDKRVVICLDVEAVESITNSLLRPMHYPVLHHIQSK